MNDQKQKDDLVYRQSVIDAILCDGPPEPHYPSWYIDKIKSVPSVNLEKGDTEKSARGEE
jgi:hypothetical protein